ncbi:MAG TPA: class I SAM-dependent methyltransferase [Caulobacteraceae bacterium]|nr:class I SAM-dependent methyltransferase [Caulobacteraceae bacterium]
MSSIAYYDENGAAFFDMSVDAGMPNEWAWFLGYVPEGGAVLDAGCGSGRDALVFLRAGRLVTAFDGSAEMVRRAACHTGLPVRQMTFEDVDWDTAFDGVWASASLLHVPRAELPAVMQRLVRALTPGGVIYASFKHGAEDRRANGRDFTDMTPRLLKTLFANAGLTDVELRVVNDGRAGREHERWTCAVGRRSG